MDNRLFLVIFSLAAVASALDLHHMVKRQIDPNALRQEIARECAQNPNGNNSQAFLASHPDWCNAYVTCEPPTAHAPCHFCGEGLYFPQGEGTCIPLFGADPQTLCNGRQYAAHADIVFIQAEERCTALARGNPPPFTG